MHGILPLDGCGFIRGLTSRASRTALFHLPLLWTHEKQQRRASEINQREGSERGGVGCLGFWKVVVGASFRSGPSAVGFGDGGGGVWFVVRDCVIEKMMVTGVEIVKCGGVLVGFGG